MQTDRFARQCNKLLVYLWIPLSVGLMIWGVEELGGVQVHHMAVLALYLYAVILSISQKTINTFNTKLLILVVYVVVTGALQNYQQLNFWLKAFSFCGVVIVANHISKTMTFDQFARYSFTGLKYTFFASIAFSILFFGPSFNEVDGKNSLNSFYGQKNTYGRLLYFFIFFCIYTKKLDGRKLNALDIFYIGVALFALVLTNSRTSQASALLIICAPYLLHIKLASRAFKVGILASVSAAIGVWMLGYMSFEGVGGNNDSISLFGLLIPMSGRTTIWDGVMNGISTENKWLFGFGLEGFYNTEYAKYVTKIGLGKTFVPADSHNGYVDLIANLGIIGALIYCVIIFKFLTNIRKTREPQIRSALYTFLVIYLVSNFTESFFVKTSNITSFMFLLLFFYSYKYTKKPSHSVNTMQSTVGHLANGRYLTK